MGCSLSRDSTPSAGTRGAVLAGQLIGVVVGVGDDVTSILDDLGAVTHVDIGVVELADDRIVRLEIGHPK